jgi:alpha-tubulin suppressor-like RCC1 family protein
MPTFYNYTQDGQIYSFDDVFVPADAFRQGNLWTWGNNYIGQLGNNTVITTCTPITVFNGGNNWKQVSSGSLHSVAIKTDGTLWTWGSNDQGQLGISIATGTRRTPVTTFLGGTNWKQVSAGNRYTAAIKTDGTLWTWGGNNSGQLGDNTTTQRNAPIQTFVGGTNWKQVSCVGDHTAAIKTDGTLWIWGRNVSGQLGDNTTVTNRFTPVTTFVGGTNWKQVSCGEVHTAAIKTDGTLWTWGRNFEGQLGVGLIINKLTPVTTFAGGTNWAVIAKGDSVQSFDYSTLSMEVAIKTDGTLWTWGYAGATLNAIPNLTPVTTFAGGTNWKSVSRSPRGGVGAIKTDGTLWVWGGRHSTIGDNTANIIPSTPVTTFAGGNNWKQISCGGYHDFAIKTDGTLWGWGFNQSSVLGLAEPASFSTKCTPVTTFAGGTNWKQVSCGKTITAAIKTDGTLWTWGDNGSGQLGRNENLSPRTPSTTFGGGTNWNQVSCGEGGMAAIKTDGTLWTWGSNFKGQLGDNTTINRSTPVTTFAGGTNWKQVSCGGYYTTAIKTDGTLWTWGGVQKISFPDIGELGNNSMTGSCTPVTTFAGGTDWALVSHEHTTLGSISTLISAVKTDGTLWTWGNDISILGINQSSVRVFSTPVTTFAGGTNWKECYAAGNLSNNTAAIKTDGSLWVWGINTTAQLGINDLTKRITPVTTFAGGTNWKSVSGAYSTTAIKTDGTLWGWGLNTFGQLGINAITSVICTPVTTFAGGTNWKQVFNRGNHTIAIISEDSIFPT